MARKDIRHAGQTYTIETFTFPLHHQVFGGVIFRPHFDQQYCALATTPPQGGLPVYQTYPTEESAIAATMNAIRTYGPHVTLLRCFLDRIQQFVMEHPGTSCVLVMSQVAFVDWRSLRKPQWEADDWLCEDQNLTSMGASNDEFLTALRTQLARVGVTDVQLDNDVPYMEIRAAGA